MKPAATYQIFLASSIVRFSDQRMAMGNSVRMLNDVALPAHNLHTKLFICEDAVELVDAGGKQAAEYNPQIGKSDLFVLLTQSEQLGQYTLEEATVAAEAAKAGKPARILVGLAGSAAATLPPQLADVLAGCAVPVEVISFEDFDTLLAATLQQLHQLDERYPTTL